MKYFDYIGKTLWVELTEQKVEVRETDTEAARLYISGSGLGAKLIFEKTGKDTDP